MSVSSSGFKFYYRLQNKTDVKITSCPPGFLGDNCDIGKIIFIESNNLFFYLINVWYKECGLSFFEQNLKIFGGTVAVANSWPAQAFLRTCDGDSCLLCGATLVDLTTVITAAHCKILWKN